MPSPLNDRGEGAERNGQLLTRINVGLVEPDSLGVLLLAPAIIAHLAPDQVGDKQPHRSELARKLEYPGDVHQGKPSRRSGITASQQKRERQPLNSTITLSRILSGCPLALWYRQCC